MKKLILAFVACMLSLTAYAQNFYVNAGYAYMDEGTFDGDGLYASFGYTFLSNAKMAHAVELEISSMDLGVDSHLTYADVVYGVEADVLTGMVNYRFSYNLAERINAFALAGLGVLDAEADIIGESDTVFAAQVGLGIELMANDTFGVQMSYSYMETGDWGSGYYEYNIGGIDSYKAGVVFYF